MTTIDSSINQICTLPNRFRGGQKSPRVLIKESGIDARKLSADALVAVLKSRPELVLEWLRWSEDKRSSPSYYFTAEGSRYVVGHYPGDERVEFDDPVDACADFIVKEVRQLS